jgi:CheY-like chemotaxis protein
MSHVLLVEDDLEISESLAELLRLQGFEVDTAHNGQEALDKLASGELPNLILLDLMMPVMNGWEFREKQLSDAQLAAIPVVVVSAVASQANGLGCAAVLQKPIEPGRLMSVVTSCGGLPSMAAPPT